MPDTQMPTRLADYAPPAFHVDTVSLVFELDPQATIVRSRLAFRRANPGPLHLDGEALTLLDIALDGAKLPPDRYTLSDTGLDLHDAPDTGELAITVRIAPAANTTLSGVYTSNGAFFTQCEAEGFRRITYFPDRPDVMARYDVTLIADRAAYPVLLSNGNPAGHGDDGARHWARWSDPHPKPSYLFALVAGDLVAVRDSFRTRSGRDVALAIYVRAGDETKCGHAMRALKTSMLWDEQTFGLEYDLDVFNIAAVHDFNGGAMENKGLNIFNSAAVLASADTATDADYQRIEVTIAHEYFHNWTGNRVTCRDWFQLSLKEGLTVFRHQEFAADHGSRAVTRIEDVRRLRATQFVEDAGPLAHPVQPKSYVAIDNFYTPTVYEKGAEVIRMMRRIIGADAFRAGMDLYFQRHDNQAVRIEDFVAAMQDASGTDLAAFQRWYHQAGTPVLTLHGDYDAAARTYALTLSQQTAGEPLVIPVAMGLLGPGGAEQPTRLAHENATQDGTRVLMLDQPSRTFTFVDVPAPPVPSLLRGFSAPVKLEGLSPDQLRLLAAHDTDAFVRWDSGHRYATHAVLGMVAAIQRGGTPATDPGLIDAIRATLVGHAADPEAAAHSLSLPGEQTLADHMDIADPDAIFAARETARAGIARALGTELRAAYDALAVAGPYSPDGASIGRRALRNTCLAYLVADAGAAPLAKTQFDAASNMTDAIAALSVLSRIDAPERAAALDAFFTRWHGDALVLDKWFALQASAPLPDAASRVRALLAHPAFDWGKPNRVRAVVSAFAGNNPVRFHAADGSGYRVLSDAILTLDPINGHVAARMVTPFGTWRRYDAARQSLMRGELHRMLAAPALGRNAREMAERSLG